MNTNDAKHLAGSPEVIGRNGAVKSWDINKIKAAIANAFLKDDKGHPWPGKTTLSSADRDVIDRVVNEVHERILNKVARDGVHSVRVEDIQDQVELVLTRQGEDYLKYARAYILYRASRGEKRATDTPNEVKSITIANGDSVTMENLVRRVQALANDLHEVAVEGVCEEAMKSLYHGMKLQEVTKALQLATRTFMERDPQYSNLAARLLLEDLHVEVLGTTPNANGYADGLKAYIKTAIQAELLDPELGNFDLSQLTDALVCKRDMQFDYLGLQTLYDRYFLHIGGRRIEMPQFFFMRVAMGLALREINREERAIEFYNLLSSFDFMSSTPTLFNSGTRRSQLSSCYLSTVEDDLDGIYEAIKENALLAKFAGGLGNDWTPVRALGAHIKGTNGKSQGVVPFLKVVNDTAVAVNQGGKRKGAVCAYLETWHLDIEEFLDLRKNTGDDRRRTHDMNTANWIPDLFMKRVMEKGEWTLFSPNDVPDLHDLYGKAFEKAFVGYEEKAARGELSVFKKVQALDLWRKMLSMIFETGHPWITFKDPCNIRSPQQHVGVVHSSNLCTEITLNTNADEIAVCNLGSVNLVNHIVDGKLNAGKLQRTVKTAMRMLDNVVDINFYAVRKARDSNLRHRPVGLGIMGFHDMLQILEVPYASDAAVTLADESTELLCYYAYSASCELAEERGAYSSFKGSLWDRGILPIDSIELLAQERGEQYLQVNTETSRQVDWVGLRERIRQHGMRNSNCVAIAPTATISNIVGVSQSLDPIYQNLHVKSNLSGEFTILNGNMVRELKNLGLWDDVMISDLKFYDGSLEKIDRVPDDLKKLYATSFEIDPMWLIEAASRRQKWIDQAQSLNLYLRGVSGKKLDEMYKQAWLRGLKTTYYLRTQGATGTEKATTRAGALNAVQVGTVPSSNTVAPPSEETAGPACFLRPGDPGFEECEACQ